MQNVFPSSWWGILHKWIENQVYNHFQYQSILLALFCFKCSSHTRRDASVICWQIVGCLVQFKLSCHVALTVYGRVKDQKKTCLLIVGMFFLSLHKFHSLADLPVRLLSICFLQVCCSYTGYWEWIDKGGGVLFWPTSFRSATSQVCPPQIVPVVMVSTGLACLCNIPCHPSCFGQTL